MKLFPSLTLVSLCAAFAGCTATTQTISFLPNGAVDGITVVINDNEIGTVNSEPLNITVRRPRTAAVYNVVYKKDGYISDEQVLEAYPDSDGLYSLLPDYPVPELVAVGSVPAEATVVAGVEEPAPEPVEDTAIAATDDVPAPEPVEDTAVAAAVAEPAPAPEAVATKDDVPALDPARTCKDIETELKLLSAQRQSGQLSEKEFQSVCAEIEREVRARYGSK